MPVLTDLTSSADEEAVALDGSPAAREPLGSARTLMIYLSTLRRLRIGNVARVAIYRTCKRAGIFRWLLPVAKTQPLGLRLDAEPVVPQEPTQCGDTSLLSEADALLAGTGRYFSVHTRDAGNPPRWFFNPFQNNEHPQTARHWSEISDFGTESGDIKVFWEMSRFQWAPVLARAWRMTADPRYLAALQEWIEDWWLRSPPNRGPQWMCGQESSIRLIHTLLALHIAGQKKTAGKGMAAFVEAHCRRVDVTSSYAVAQDNNHATSEAAGLFIGGTWLARHGEGGSRSRGQEWASKGRRLLERAVRRLVAPDGSFSQHSLTYHRVMLDTLSTAEAWRRRLREAAFTETLYERAGAATRWLGAMIDPSSGDGPNLGTNDGAHPFHLDQSAYRDFRPCLQLASLLFVGRPALAPGPWNDAAAWFDIPTGETDLPWCDGLSSAVFPDGGYVILRNETGARVLLRTPTARFRPAQADALHADLWWKGTNLLRDGGTYSYAGGTLFEELAGARGHNTLQFDDRDQMPRLGRFLYGSWVRVAGDSAIVGNGDGQSWTGSYTDAWGARHQRTVTLRANVFSVLDQVQGFKRNAVLRWRLAPGNWSQNQSGCASPTARIDVKSSVPVRHLSLTPGWESRHYLEASRIPVLEVEIGQAPAIVATTVTLS